MPRSIKPPSNKTSWSINGTKGDRDKRMPKVLSTWTDEEAIRRSFLLTPEDLLFLQPTRADAQRLYRALVLLWARVERILVSDPTILPTEVIAHVSKQLGLKPSVLAELRN